MTWEQRGRCLIALIMIVLLAIGIFVLTAYVMQDYRGV